MADELSEFQVSAFRDAFNEFDEDGDGFITSRELGKVLAALGRNPTDFELVRTQLLRHHPNKSYYHLSVFKNLKTALKNFTRSLKLLVTFDRMMPQKSYRHIWKAESLRISKICTILLYLHSVKRY